MVDIVKLACVIFELLCEGRKPYVLTLYHVLEEYMVEVCKG